MYPCSHSFPTDAADKWLPIGVRLSRAFLATAHPVRLPCNPALCVFAFCDLWNQPIAAWVNTRGPGCGQLNFHSGGRRLRALASFCPSSTASAR
jgi:hypothetical protein